MGPEEKEKGGGRKKHEHNKKIRNGTRGTKARNHFYPE